MNLPRYPLRVNVGFLLNQPIGTHRDIHFEFESLPLPPDLELTGVQGVVRISCTPQGLLTQGEFKAGVTAECVRCLEPFRQPLKMSFSELFANRNHPVSESGLIIPEDANIDFAPLVSDYFILEIPISPVCSPECKGLCMVCGENLNLTTCEHSEHSKSN